MKGRAVDVPTNLEDLEAAARKLGDSGAHHSYIDEVMNAVAEIKELRAMVARIPYAAPTTEGLASRCFPSPFKLST